jgi:hypothetical protein
MYLKEQADVSQHIQILQIEGYRSVSLSTPATLNPHFHLFKTTG